MIKQINQEIQNRFEIRGPVALSLPTTKNFQDDQQYFIKKLLGLQKRYGLGNTDKITRYHEKWWENKIASEAKKSKISLDKQTKNALISRWVFGNKSKPLNSKNYKDEKVLDWAKKMDKVSFNKFAQQNIAPFDNLFLEPRFISAINSALDIKISFFLYMGTGFPETMSVLFIFMVLLVILGS